MLIIGGKMGKVLDLSLPEVWEPPCEPKEIWRDLATPEGLKKVAQELRDSKTQLVLSADDIEFMSEIFKTNFDLFRESHIALKKLSWKNHELIQCLTDLDRAAEYGHKGYFESAKDLYCKADTIPIREMTYLKDAVISAIANCEQSYQVAKDLKSFYKT